MDVKPLRYDCFPLLPTGGVLIIGAPAKSLKSWIAMNLAYTLAEGTPFLGFPIERQHKVLYLEQEIGRWGLADRFKKIHEHHAGSFVESNLLIHYKSREPISLVPDTIGHNNLVKLVKEFDPQVVVFDPMREFHLLDEDNSTEMTKVFQGIFAVQQAEDEDGPKRSVVLVHHAGKRSDFRSRKDPEALRGSSKIFDAGDSYMMIEAGEGDVKTLKLYFKFRHAGEIPPMSVDFDAKSGTFKKREKGE